MVAFYRSWAIILPTFGGLGEASNIEVNLLGCAPESRNLGPKAHFQAEGPFAAVLLGDFVSLGYIPKPETLDPRP